MTRRLRRGDPVDEVPTPPAAPSLTAPLCGQDLETPSAVVLSPLLINVLARTRNAPRDEPHQPARPLPVLVSHGMVTLARQPFQRISKKVISGCSALTNSLRGPYGPITNCGLAWDCASAWRNFYLGAHRHVHAWSRGISCCGVDQLRRRLSRAVPPRRLESGAATLLDAVQLWCRNVATEQICARSRAPDIESRSIICTVQAVTKIHRQHSVPVVLSILHRFPLHQQRSFRLSPKPC
jgi:hypothetical protein